MCYRAYGELSEKASGEANFGKGCKISGNVCGATEQAAAPHPGEGHSMPCSENDWKETWFPDLGGTVGE